MEEEFDSGLLLGSGKKPKEPMPFGVESFLERGGGFETTSVKIIISCDKMRGFRSSLR